MKMFCTRDIIMKFCNHTCKKGILSREPMKMLKADTDAKDEKEGTFMSKIMQIFSLELFLNPA